MYMLNVLPGTPPPHISKYATAWISVIVLRQHKKYYTCNKLVFYASIDCRPISS